MNTVTKSQQRVLSTQNSLMSVIVTSVAYSYYGISTSLILFVNAFVVHLQGTFAS